MRTRENSHRRHHAALAEMARAGRLGAWVSIHLTAYAHVGDFDQRPRTKPTSALAAWAFALTVCLRSIARPLAIFAVSFGAISFGSVTSAHAEASSYLCEAVFSGSLPVLEELAQLKVAANQAQAAGKSELAVTLYRAFQKSSEQAKADGVDLRGLKAMLDEVEVRENKKSLDEEAREKRTRTLEEVKIIDGSRAVFQSIAPGKFMMGEVGKQIETEITGPFGMAATQTTQIVWKKVVAQAKLKFPGKYDALDPDPSKFKGELNPVEKVSWDDVQLWLSALNELAAQGDAIVNEVMPGHKPGEIYRLPTEAEWEFVVRRRGEAQGAYHFGENEAELNDHAWFQANAQNRTHPVAQKKPLIIDGREFYDLHGNVWEWVQDSWDGHSSFKVGRGGSWGNDMRDLRSAVRNGDRPVVRGTSGGFRLVRALP